MGWDTKTWSLCIDARNYFRCALEEKDKEVNNESVIKLCEIISGFGDLRSQLDAFITTEKSLAFSRLMDDINRDVTSILNDIRKKKIILEKSFDNQSLDVLKEQIHKEKDKLEKSQTAFDDILGKVRNEYAKPVLDEKFGKYKTDMQLLRNWSSIKDIQLEAENILSEVEKTKSIILDGLAMTLKGLWDKSCATFDIVLPQIDFRTIALDAEKKNTERKKEGYEKKLEKRKTFGGKIKRFFGWLFGNDSWGYDEVDDYDRPKYGETHTDYVKAAHDFANKVYDTFSTSITSFVDDLYKYIQKVGDTSKVEAEKQIKLQQDSYSALVDRNQTLENQKKTIDAFEAKINTLQTILTELNELSHD